MIAQNFVFNMATLSVRQEYVSTMTDKSWEIVKWDTHQITLNRIGIKQQTTSQEKYLIWSAFVYGATCSVFLLKTLVLWLRNKYYVKFCMVFRITDISLVAWWIIFNLLNYIVNQVHWSFFI